jgi:dipeptidase E
VRLYLSSLGLGDRPEQLLTLAGSAGRAAIVLNALDNLPHERAGWLKDQTEKLAGLGFSVVELDLRNYFGAFGELARFLGGLDLVWINGGNAFILRRAMKQSGFDKLVRAALVRDALVYAGFSAAAVVAYESLKGLELVDDPHDVPFGYDADVVWEGLGLIPFALAVHFKSDDSQSALIDRAIAYYEANGIPYRTLRDGEALVVHGDREQIVGSYK